MLSAVVLSIFDWKLSEVTNLNKLDRYENSRNQFSRSGIDICGDSYQKSSSRGWATVLNFAIYWIEWDKTEGKACWMCHQVTLQSLHLILLTFDLVSSWNDGTVKIFCNIPCKVPISLVQRTIFMPKTQKGEKQCITNPCPESVCKWNPIFREFQKNVLFCCSSVNKDSNILEYDAV